MTGNQRESPPVFGQAYPGVDVHHDLLGFIPNAFCFGHNWVLLVLVIRVSLSALFRGGPHLLATVPGQEAA